MSYSELTDLAPVGQGGYGVVYRANCGRFGTVAFKELNIQILGKRYLEVVLVPHNCFGLLRRSIQYKCKFACPYTSN